MLAQVIAECEPNIQILKVHSCCAGLPVRGRPLPPLGRYSYTDG